VRTGNGRSICHLDWSPQKKKEEVPQEKMANPTSMKGKAGEKGVGGETKKPTSTGPAAAQFFDHGPS